MRDGCADGRSPTSKIGRKGGAIHHGGPGPRARPSTSLRRAVVAGVVLAVGSAGCSDARQPSQPFESMSDRPAFDGTRAFQLVETQVAFGPRVPGWAGHAAQLDWMLDTLSALADEVAVDSFTQTTTGGEELELYNVRATFLPASPRTDGRRLLLLAHWDTRPQSDQSDLPGADTIPVPGANDGASGVAVLIELARLLAEQAAPVTVDLLFVDGEDYGPGAEDMFFGSERFAATVPDELRPAYAILLDMVGDADPRFPIEGWSAEHAPDVAQRVWGIAGQLGYARTFPVEVGRRITDDHIPLNEAGIPTIDIIDFTYGGPDNAYWHTPEDTPDKIGASTLDMVGEVVAEVVYRGG